MGGPTATVMAGTARHRVWLEVYGSDTVPILSPAPVRNTVEGEEHLGEREFYMLDLRALSDAARERVVRHVMTKCGWDRQYTVEQLETVGMPLLAEGLVVGMDARAFV